MQVNVMLLDIENKDQPLTVLRFTCFVEKRITHVFEFHCPPHLWQKGLRRVRGTLARMYAKEGLMASKVITTIDVASVPR